MPTRNDAYQLMTTHVKNESLQKHMLSVEAAMRFYARKYGEDEELWAITGLLHDCSLLVSRRIASVQIKQG